jgi:hypothetical protein
MTTSNRFAIVITSIYEPTKAVVEIARHNSNDAFDFIIAADKKSPDNYNISNCIYYTLEQQKNDVFSLGRLCPTGHYARKNLGYLLAISRGCSYLLETDDDNIPMPSFWSAPQRQIKARRCSDQDWVNIYRYFTDALIWPRGLPLNRIQKPPTPLSALLEDDLLCPIQQGLADENPDVDALYRLICTLPQSFPGRYSVALSKGSWCPFNSQNTTWFPEAYPLLYLPAYCSFRMTDIWRSFVAQRICWENDWSLLFSPSSVYQERNEHDLMKDFEDEVPGYLHNETIATSLAALNLSAGIHNIPDNMLRCYRKLIELGLIDASELQLLEAWLDDLAALPNAIPQPV